MDKGYIFDRDSVKFRRAKTSVRKKVRRISVFILATMSMSVLYYVIFSLFFSTETERRLKHENAMYEQILPELEEKERLLSDVISCLAARDNNIYEQIFHAPAPSINPVQSADQLSGVGEMDADELVGYAADKLEGMEEGVAAVESNFQRIMEIMSDPEFVAPPLTAPIKNLTFAQVGASTGNKVNPFYKVSVPHNGLDIIAHSGEPVYAAADGVVKNVTMSRKGLGNVVEIQHKNGYVTRYAHLSDVFTSAGSSVTRGTRIGNVGLTGNTYAPHLHYEVAKDTVICDPLNHFFVSLSPEEYMNMLIMAASVGQSLD